MAYEDTSYPSICENDVEPWSKPLPGQATPSQNRWHCGREGGRAAGPALSSRGVAQHKEESVRTDHRWAAHRARRAPAGGQGVCWAPGPRPRPRSPGRGCEAGSCPPRQIPPSLWPTSVAQRGVECAGRRSQVGSGGVGGGCRHLRAGVTLGTRTQSCPSRPLCCCCLPRPAPSSTANHHPQKPGSCTGRWCPPPRPSPPAPS